MPVRPSTPAGPHAPVPLTPPPGVAGVPGVVVQVNLSGLQVPRPVARVTRLLSGGGLAIMLLRLGIRLARLSPRAGAGGGAALATGLGLVVAPPVAWVTGRWSGWRGRSARPAWEG
jgi:hypothetical protein